MAKVYVVNRGGHDYSSAQRFGTLVYCTEGQLSKYDTAQMYRQLMTCLADSGPDDFILLTSLTTLCSVAAAIFAVKHHRVNFLIHRKEEGYVERTVVLEPDGNN